jgi:hypothetical protein
MAKPHFINWVETRGQQLRARCELPPFARLDPYHLAAKMQTPVITPAEIHGMEDHVLEQVLVVGCDAWDAGTVSLPDGSHIIVMNPKKGRERQNASLMEELAHIHLGHKPTRFQSINGIVLREWNQSQETQAYWVGAAALVPRRVMKGAITRRMNILDVASQCQVSRELMEFREKLLGLRLLRPSIAI